MKLLTLLFFLVTTSITAQSLDAVRASYIHINEGKEAIAVFEERLVSVKQSSNIKDAYKGALMIMQSKIVKGIKNKKELFKEGVSLIENAVTKDSTNIEIRVIRLSIQENTPKFLKYRGAIKEDKELILKSFQRNETDAVRSFVRGYVQQSSVFTAEEKTRF